MAHRDTHRQLPNKFDQPHNGKPYWRWVTESKMLTELARMNHSLIALGHAELQINLFDDDVITIAN